MVALSTIWSDNVGLDRIFYFIHGAIWQVKRRLGLSFVTTLANGARVKIYPNTSFSGVFYSRWLERKDTLFIRAHADVARTFVDVGANTGIMAAQFFDKFPRFYLFEPAPSSYSVLAETCKLNPHVDCKTFMMALADKPGMEAFIDEGNYSGTSRLMARPSDSDSLGARREVVVDTLDNALRGTVEDIVLKIDVEGGEERVFAGALSLFASQRVKLVMFERLGRTNLDNLMRFFEKHDYVVFYVRDDGSATRNECLLRTPLINLFACPRSIAQTLQVP
jgi:FkbM family methyltransferase